jgi:hypothetical protein
VIRSYSKLTAKSPLQPPTYSIVLPAYCESERLAATLDKILVHAQQFGWKLEVIVEKAARTKKANQKKAK